MGQFNFEETKVNAELGLIVAVLGNGGSVNAFYEGVRFGKAHCFAVMETAVFAPKDCDNRLCVGIGRGEIIFRLLCLRFVFGGFFRGCFFRFWCVCFGFGCVCFFLRRGFILRRFLRLCLLLILCQLRKVFIYVRNQPGGGVTDCFKGRFQFRQFPPAAPFCNIGKGIVGSVKPVMLAHGVGNAFRLYFTGAAVWAVCLLLCGGVQIYVVQLGVCNLMYQRFKVLQFAHALVNGNAFVLLVVVTLCAASYFFKTYRDGGSLLCCLKEIGVLFHVPGQLVNADSGKLLSLGLRYVKDGNNLERRDGYFCFLLDGITVFVGHGLLGLGVDFVNFLFDFVRGRGKYLDTFRLAYHLPPVVFFP